MVRGKSYCCFERIMIGKCFEILFPLMLKYPDLSGYGFDKLTVAGKDIIDQAWSFILIPGDLVPG